MINNKTLKNECVRFVEKRMRRAAETHKKSPRTEKDENMHGEEVPFFGFAEIAFEQPNICPDMNVITYYTQSRRHTHTHTYGHKKSPSTPTPAARIRSKHAQADQSASQPAQLGLILSFTY